MLSPLPVEPGYFFDFVSILQVKYNHARTLANSAAFEFYCLELDKCYGEALAAQVLSSYEYKRLLVANEAIYMAQEHIMKHEEIIDSEALIKLNTIRFRKKAELQKKFFGSELKEYKSF